jgi:hypothetical protein
MYSDGRSAAGVPHPERTSRMRHLFAGLALTLALTGGARAGHIVVNGGFETGDFTGWTQGGAPNSSVVNHTAPHSGSYAAYLQAVNGVGSLSQALATAAGDQLHLSFWLKVNGDDDKKKSPQNSFEVWLGGDLLFSGSNLHPANYKQYTFDTTATGPSTGLVFTFSNKRNFFHLDDVSVDDTGSTVGVTGGIDGGHAPEPASLALAAVGALGVGLAARRRRPA